MPTKSCEVLPLPAAYVGSIGMPARAAASAHWSLRCSVGATTVIRSTIRRPSSSAATDSAKVVLPAPGVATARKSRGCASKYCRIAAVCHARSDGAVPQAARSGQAGVSAIGLGVGLGPTRHLEPEPEPGSSLRDSQASLHSGQTGNFSGARLGTQTLPHSATTGVPITIASVSLSFST